MDISSQSNNGINMNYINSINHNKSILTSSPSTTIYNSNNSALINITNNQQHQNNSSSTLQVIHQKRQIPQNFVSFLLNNNCVIRNNEGGSTSSSSSLSSATSSSIPTLIRNAINNRSYQNNLINISTIDNNNSNSNYYNSDSDLLPPPKNVTILDDRYLILNQLDGSSFYECVDIRNGESLICKAIGNSYSKILSAYFRLDGEEHIKQLHKLLQGSDQTYLILSPSKFGDLHSFVRERRRLRETEARHLFRQICKTVRSCHNQGIVLRDLKLRKFVFTDHNRTHLKFESLEDAVVLDDPNDDILKEKIGCPAYVAPEILKPNSDFSGKAADLWSLGVILYTMLVGRYPFNDPEHSSLFAKIARCQFTIPDYVSSKARCLIKSLLQKVPKQRLTSDDVLYHPWLLEEDLCYSNDNGNITLSTTNNNSSSSSGNSESPDDLSMDDQRVPELDTMDFT